jgi:two-component system CheB/CheR fusion protein
LNLPALKIVGIGASAGGVEAFRGFFEAMPANSGLCFVVILHLDPQRRSLLPEILARWTEMEVIAAEDGMTLAPDTVFVVPAGRAATLEGLVIRLRTLMPEERHLTAVIDGFFDSMAQYGPHCVGIVLSGTGHDGALGLKAIRDVGGMTIAQGGPEGTAPIFAGMPDSAIATGAVDLILPVQQMPGVLVNAQVISDRLERPDLASDAAVQAARLTICDLLLARLGHDFSQYKDKTFMRRVHRRMQVVNVTKYEDYAERLGEDREECVLLFRDLLIGVTSFFRDIETFEVLARDVMPRLFAGKGPRKSVRVWIAGCATGEEAYSIAILLREYADQLAAPPAIQVFATDIDEFAIAAARAARYPATLMQGVSAERLARFFVKTESGYVVGRAIRDICTFSPHSLIRDPPFSRVDFISCRNLLIYLDSDLQARVIPIFHYALAPEGILLLGSSETVSRFEKLFATLDKKHRIFQRCDVPSTLPQLPARAIEVDGEGRVVVPVQDNAAGLRPQAISRARSRVLEAYASPFVVVTASGEVLHYSSRTGRFFEPAPGPPSKNLFDMARASVRLGLRAGLRRAAESGQRVQQSLPEAEAGEDDSLISLFVEPLSIAAPEQIFLVVFIETPRGRRIDLDDGGLSQEEHRIAAALERENRELREQLQSVREEHETTLEEGRSANEELHSVNEELQSSNEELETSREEIQSINEEMSTVNAQLSIKLEELDRANSDLRNLFESTKVATVFLDRNLVIRAFTPEVAAVYNLIPSDVGRPLVDIVNRLNYQTLREDVAQVLATLAPLERRVAREDGDAHYLMRILPYRSPDSSIDGSLITFVEVTSIMQAEQHQRLLVDELNHRVKNMLTVVISLASQTLRRSATMEAFGTAFLGRVQALTKAYELLSGRSWEDVPLGDIVREELSPFIDDKRLNVRLSGADIALDARGALAVGMAIHELTTNAVKYGALSVPEGDVAVTWSIEDVSEGESFVLDWVERNGPKVVPAKPGFGLLLIERGLKHDLAGQAVVEFLPEGVRARLRAPLRRSRLAPA